jgi:hypothetical protein
MMRDPWDSWFDGRTSHHVQETVKDGILYK